MEDPWHFLYVPARVRYYKKGVDRQKDNGVAKI